MARVREIEIHEKSFLKIRDVRTGVIVSGFSEAGESPLKIKPTLSRLTRGIGALSKVSSGRVARLIIKKAFEIFAGHTAASFEILGAFFF
jgi:hypothetical protein